MKSCRKSLVQNWEKWVSHEKDEWRDQEPSNKVLRALNSLESSNK